MIYRTIEQALEIQDACYYGNWGQARNLRHEYGFSRREWVEILIDHHKELGTPCDQLLEVVKHSTWL